jgi:homoserine kinase, Neisseria type
MAVYTRVGRPELVDFLRGYGVGELLSYEAIPQGIEHTNYFVTTTGGHFVLTLFEFLKPEEIVCHLRLMAFLAENGVASAHPIANGAQHHLGILRSRPAALVTRLPGASIMEPEVAHCRAVGAALARLHTVGQAFPLHLDNMRGPAWWQKTSQKLAAWLTTEDATILKDELRFQSSFRCANLPRGMIHGDLFRDNVLFENNKITGIIDLYYACTDALLFDVAVTVNDWCSRPDGTLDKARTRALLAGYNQKRPLKASEHEAWPTMLRAAALRFWLSRLKDLHFPRAGEITRIKNPQDYKVILLKRIENGIELKELF